MLQAFDCIINIGVQVKGKCCTQYIHHYIQNICNEKYLSSDEVYYTYLSLAGFRCQINVNEFVWWVQYLFSVLLQLPRFKSTTLIYHLLESDVK